MKYLKFLLWTLLNSAQHIFDTFEQLCILKMVPGYFIHPPHPMSSGFQGTKKDDRLF